MSAISTLPLTLDGLTGIRYVPCRIGCYYPPSVEGSDILEVNFDQKSLRHDSLYLVEWMEGSKVTHRACRRFQVTPAGWQIDQDGKGDWLRFTSLERFGMRVAGEVREVYKPSGHIREIVSSAVMAPAKTLANQPV